MDPIKIVEALPGQFSLLLNAGTTDVDDVVEALGHEPNGYFWEGIAELLMTIDAPGLRGRLALDPEADMFVAYGTDRRALDELGALMTAVATDGQRVQQLIAYADENGFEFDDSPALPARPDDPTTRRPDDLQSVPLQSAGRTEKENR